MLSNYFYRNVNSDIFYQWILINKNQYQKYGIHCIPYFQDQYRKIIHFENDDILGVVTSYYNHLCEEEIFDKKDHSLLFYLHYEMVNIKQCCHLFEEFFDALKYNISKPPIKILLCCSTGLTTGFFATKTQELIHLEHSNYELEAIGYSEIPIMYEKYDAIYFAPQITYLIPEAILITKKQTAIYEIPATIFATLDSKAFLDILKTNHKI